MVSKTDVRVHTQLKTTCTDEALYRVSTMSVQCDRNKANTAASPLCGYVVPSSHRPLRLSVVTLMYDIPIGRSLFRVEQMNFEGSSAGTQLRDVRPEDTAAENHQAVLDHGTGSAEQQSRAGKTSQTPRCVYQDSNL
jgi:hypothetical protein